MASAFVKNINGNNYYYHPNVEDVNDDPQLHHEIQFYDRIPAGQVPAESVCQNCHLTFCEAQECPPYRGIEFEVISVDELKSLLE